MSTASQRANRQRIRAAILALCAMSTCVASIASAYAEAPRFQIDAHVGSRQMPQTGGGLDLSAVVTEGRSSLSGGSYSISASAIASPYACGGDTIFANGFDP
jgi:hypothetical protein